MATLTPRERQVLERARGTDKEVASLLGLSVRTVRAHRRSIAQKLKARTKVDAVVLFLEAGGILIKIEE
jgi:DNA-binding CsgD family transcriptional regulator